MPTNPTPAEIVSLERDIAEGVMGWTWVPSIPALLMNGYWADADGNEAASAGWSPWNNPADALEVLDGPAVCLLAEKVMEERKEER